jgi:hypothetical protein
MEIGFSVTAIATKIILQSFELCLTVMSTCNATAKGIVQKNNNNLLLYISTYMIFCAYV